MQKLLRKNSFKFLLFHNPLLTVQQIIVEESYWYKLLEIKSTIK